MPTLEIRTCGALEVHRITGPVVPVREAVLYNSSIAHISPAPFDEVIFNDPTHNDDGMNPLTTDAAELTVDISHVSHSLFFTSGGHSDAQWLGSSKGDVYSRLVRYCSEHTTICGINARKCSCVDAATNSSNSISVHLKRSEKRSDTTSSAAYVQFVVRFYVDKRSSFTDRIIKVTRVWTQRLPVADDIEEYAHGLDAELWGYVMGRGIVADYHGKVLETFDGACAKEYSLEGDRDVVLHMVFVFRANLTSSISVRSLPVSSTAT